MANPEQSLALLEQILNEMYWDETTNKRRREIEEQLNQFKKQDNCLKECCYFLENSRNVFVLAFCTRYIEEIVFTKWFKLSAESKAAIKSLLKRYIAEVTKFSTTDRHRFLKLYIDIARYEWPHENPNFIEDTVAFVADTGKGMTVMFVHLLLEEFIDPREVLLSRRKDELRHQLSFYVPQFLTFLMDMLDGFCKSPSQWENSIVGVTFDCLSKIIQWVPLSDHFNEAMLESIYRFLNTGVKLSALETMNEILYKNCIPMNKVHLVVHVSKRISQQFQELLAGENTQFDEDHSYVKKLLDSIHQIVSAHWHRLEANNSGSLIIELMTSFHVFTFQVRDLEFYYECLDTWCTFFGYLKMRCQTHVAQYEQLLMLLVVSIIKKMQSAHSLFRDQMEFTDFTEDSNYSTFFNQNSRIVESVANILPSVTILNIVDMWKQSSVHCNAIMSSLEQSVMVETEETVKVVENFVVCTRLLLTVRTYMTQEPSKQCLLDMAKLILYLREAFPWTRVLDETMKAFKLLHCELILAMATWLGDASYPKNQLRNLQLFQRLIFSYMTILVGGRDSQLANCTALLVKRLVEYTCDIWTLEHLATNFAFPAVGKQIREELQITIINGFLALNDGEISDKEDMLHRLVNFISDHKFHIDGNFKETSRIVHRLKPKNAASKKVLFKLLKGELEYINQSFLTTCSSSHLVKCRVMINFHCDCFVVLGDIVWPLTEKAVSIFVYCFRELPFPGDKDMECHKALFEFLETVIMFPGAPFGKLAIPYLNFCKQCLSLSDDTSEALEVKFCALKLLFTMLQEKFPYFWNGEHITEVESIGAIDFILNAFLTNIQNADTSLLKYTLQCLDEISNKWALYQKDIFRNQYLASFEQALLSSLVRHRDDILTESIITTLFHMASIDLCTFYNNLMVHFIRNIPGLLDDQRSMLQRELKREGDLPSFTINFTRFFNDIKFYYMYNGV